MQTTTFSTPDIVCDGCAQAIKKSLGGLTGITDVAIDIAAKHVTVTHEASVSRETLVSALDRAGFSVAA